MVLQMHYLAFINVEKQLPLLRPWNNSTDLSLKPILYILVSSANFNNLLLTV